MFMSSNTNLFLFFKSVINSIAYKNLIFITLSRILYYFLDFLKVTLDLSNQIIHLKNLWNKWSYLI